MDGAKRRHGGAGDGASPGMPRENILAMLAALDDYNGSRKAGPAHA
jgi:hypothetical protein